MHNARIAMLESSLFYNGEKIGDIQEISIPPAARTRFAFKEFSIYPLPVNPYAVIRNFS